MAPERDSTLLKSGIRHVYSEGHIKVTQICYDLFPLDGTDLNQPYDVPFHRTIRSNTGAAWLNLPLIAVARSVRPGAGYVDRIRLRTISDGAGRIHDDAVMDAVGGVVKSYRQRTSHGLLLSDGQ